MNKTIKKLSFLCHKISLKSIIIISITNFSKLRQKVKSNLKSGTEV